jgi:CO/xanthine dehydrogenase FAD-binding subunit
VEKELIGAPAAEAPGRVRPADVMAPLRPIDDVRASADYRMDAAVELVRRAVAEALA